MTKLNPKLLATLERFLDDNEPETVTACVMLLRRLGAAERIHVADYLVELETARASDDAS